MHWSRWGDPDHTTTLPAGATDLMALAFGEITPRPAVPLAAVVARLPTLAPDVADRLAAVVGADHLTTDLSDRVHHTRGKSTPDLLAARSGDFSDAPDAVVRPGNDEEVVAVLQVCAAHGVAVVPYGGGTSVVGGLVADRAELHGLVSLDLCRLDALVDLDEVSRTATLQAGMLGPQAETLLGERGYTLGHFPQSFEFASIGGFAATRSSGQSSSGYGRFDSMVVSVTVATARGLWSVGAAPASAAGPDLRQLVLGSEGALGVITDVTVMVRPVPAEKVYETWRWESFEAGAQAMRTLVQDDLNPTVLRLSDETETSINLSDPSAIGLSDAGGAQMVCGYEGSADRVARMRAEVAATLRAAGGQLAGEDGGAAWSDGRFAAPYLRDALLDEGVLVETLETATVWSNLRHLYDEVLAAVTSAATRQGTDPLILCHISHVYRAGASLYFTVAMRESDDGIRQWAPVKRAAGDAIRAAGGTITHHHAVGRDHKPWLADEIGVPGVAVLRAAKQALDPEGVLNPGVLVP
ncbi:FAD-binding oxidoreductase [Flexivirga oryzae]|uniref:Alkyldihydroxyacetonephosphate synthase n=1 Tax=Flexivirga oryzae TaxID=1794944 RepID=A0A839NGN6_9MICO|nr:FAD-binding oxidoreductase [Flexivirga oryzae]MBB2894766.1 alkyldihydroxyacetonephosphate synthase [Flexivirga oryzae]